MAAERVYIGIDTTAGKRLLTYAVLDGDLNQIESADANFEGVLEAVASYPAALCAVDAPSGPNLGLMAEPGYRQGLGLSPNGKRYATYRVGEYELRRRNIGLYRTPIKTDDAPAWMHLGWQLFEQLEGQGYARYPQGGSRQMFEVHPHACFTVMLQHRPYRKDTFEGRMQRQLLLYEEGLDIGDPMLAFEEWTRFHILSGKIGMGGLLRHDELDALGAAYTAYLLGQEPERTMPVGDPGEGIIIVPTGELLDRYP